jgi:hypothetical protein
MIEVAMHKFNGSSSPEEVERDLRFAREKLVSRLEGRPAACGMQVRAQFIRACAAHHQGREEDALELLMASCETTGAMFAAISARPDTEVTFPFRGRNLSARSGPPDHHASPISWVTNLALALALRRSDVIDILVEVPARILEQANQHDTCFAHLVHALQSFLSDEDPDESLTDFEHFSKPAQLERVSSEFASRFRGVASCLRAIAANDQSDFDKSLVAQLTMHKKASGRGTAASDCSRLIDPLSSGMAVLGQEHGLTLNVESEYMPRWLITSRLK